MADLRPGILDDLGIIATISWICREFEKIYSAIQVKKEIGVEEEETPEPLKIVIFRIDSGPGEGTIIRAACQLS